MVNKAQEKQLISNAEDLVEKISNGEQTENQYVLDLATHSYILSDFTSQLEDIYMGIDVATARGEQLDRIGNLVNVERVQGQPAMILLQLSLELAEANDITIPAGTKVIIDELQVDPYITYTTDSQVTIQAGMTTASVTCSSDLYAFQRSVPAETVYGLEGFSLVNATNREAGTTGRNIEEDDDYRQRILLWNVKNQIGTRAAFDSYLLQYEGLDDYQLIPQYQGVGTLCVVCDCPEAYLEKVQNDIQDNCMLFTDDPCYCVKVTPTNLDLTVSAVITREPIQHTVQEIIELACEEIRSFVNGGASRTGGTIHGRGIGNDFVESQLMMHLHNTFPEFLSISVTEYSVTDDNGDPVEINEYRKLRARDVNVVIE